MKTIITLLLGAAFGYVLIASEAFHWVRIQEMFHFKSFHMYGLLASAIGTAALSLYLIRRLKIRDLSGALIEVKPKEVRPFGNLLGGLCFGLGWGITGACSAPLFVLIGLNWKLGLVAVLSALSGAILYAFLKPYLPK
jgi:uncharacterized protein